MTTASRTSSAPASLQQLSPLKLALLAERARAESGPLLRADPIAIVGMACRLPGGVKNPQAFWDLLRDGVDAVGELPAGRWDAASLYDPDPSVPGKIATKWGGFLEAIDGFDAAYFGILPREAERMDPQQRVFLEVAVEALDHAGFVREKLAGSRTGAFIASYYNEYAQLQYADPQSIDARTLTGTVHSVLVNRLSYLLDLHGPSVSVDTACSSSLVAIHLACQSLRDGESDVALAGGVSLMVSEAQMLSLSKVGFMAPDGRCKTFDSRADGFGRGEGCSILVLKRLSDAIADGDRVLALIRGSAVNQDGHSTVLAAPNGLAQQNLIREALANAQVSPSSVGYIEAHGTGTMLGDPIEVEALAATVGQPAPDAGPCLIGAAKANIGHLEAAAGATGVVKSVLVLQHGQIPPQVHFKALNPHISLAGTRLEVPTRLTPWPAGKQPRCIGTSGFGVGGTNAHVVLQEAPRLTDDGPPAYGAAPWLLPLSAQSDAALNALATRWVDFLGKSELPLANLCATAGQRRSHLDHRLAVVGESAAQVAERLQAFAAGGSPQGVASGRRPLAGGRRLAFVFSGQGQQWLGMGRELMAREPVFRDALVAVEASLRSHVPWSLLEELAAPEDQSRLDDTEVAQPAIFGIQVALAALWAHWGFVPQGVVGHSVGEIAALHVSGVLSLEEAVRIVVLRARFMQRATGQGAMAAVGLTEAQARERVAPFDGQLSIGAINSPRNVVLSGDGQSLQRLLATLHADGVAQRALPVNYAFHSAQMQPHADALVDALGAVQAAPASLPVYSTITGTILGKTPVDGRYFGRNVRETVRFAPAIAAMLDDGFDTFVELSAHPVLANALAECAEAHAEAGAGPGDGEMAIHASLRRGRPERESLLLACAGLYAAGFAPDWLALQGDHAQVHDLPAYPWQHQRYWLPAARTTTTAPAASAFTSGATVPAGGLLARRLPIAGMTVFETQWPDEAAPWLADHRVGGRLLLPGMGMLEALRQAASAALDQRAVQVEDFIILRPLVLGEAQAGTAASTRWQVQATEPEGARTALTLFVEDADAPGRWHKVATASACVAPASTAAIDATDASPLTESPVAGRYQAFADAGIEFGPAFRTLDQLQLGGGRAQARLVAHASAGRFDGCHPTLLDGALQAGMAACAEWSGGRRYLPLATQRYVAFDTAAARSSDPLRAEVQARRGEGGAVHIDARLFSEDGREVAFLEGVRLAEAADDAATDRWLHEINWSPLQEAAAQDSPAPQSGAWLLLADDQADTQALATPLRAALEAAGCPVSVAHPSTVAASLADAGWRSARSLQGVVLLALGAADGCTPTQLAHGLQVVQSLARCVPDTPVQLCVVTQGAQPAGAAIAHPAGAALWGLGSATAVEHPELALRLIDLDPDAATPDAQALADELLRGRAGQSRIAWREGTRWAPRLQRLAAPASVPQQLVRGGDGTLDGLHWTKAASAPAPEAGQVQIGTVAAGLNFRDVLMALGMIPGQQTFFGAECAGVVTAVGGGVDDLVVGDLVFGFVPGSLASVVNAPAAFVTRWPGELGSLEQAAALPVAFLTAMVGLQRIAGLRAGQRVLIHSAAGGVGLAAVQIARRAGAEVLATAGSPAKRDMLRALGVRHVFDSRSTDFTADVLAATGGNGADVVLNSLAGEFIGASVRALAADGCFLELGKRELWTPERFAAERPRARYEVYDLGSLAAADPSIVRPMLAELLDALRDRSLQPPPLRVFAHDQVGAAMRQMAQARHVGKLALRLPLPRKEAAPHEVVAALLRDDATYLITGGLGALGLHTARWLVQQGARHLLLLGRHGPGEAATSAIDAMRAAGASVTVHAADVADADAMRALLDQVDAGVAPLRGIVHAAGRLDDGVLLQQSPERFAAVRRGKAEGAFVLDALTRQRSLDFFVLYSAVGLLLGPSGQGPYAAANAELDALAHRRRAAGLPALSVAWGLWRDGGMASTMAADGRDTWTERGLQWIDPAAGLARLQRLLRERAVHSAVLPIDWSKFLCRLPEGLDPGFFAGLGRPASSDTSGNSPAAATNAVSAGAAGLVDSWRALPPGQRREALLAHLTAQSLQVLGLPGTTGVLPRLPLKEMGLDSLMAVELRNLLARSLGTSLPATLLFDHPSLDALVRFLGPRLGLVDASATPAGASRRAAHAAAGSASGTQPKATGLDEMSDDEAEAQLLAELQPARGAVPH